MKKQLTHKCRFEDRIIEMHGDIKTLISEFKAMNGSLRNTKINLEKHETDSEKYRRMIDVVWTVTHTLKWIAIFTVGYGFGRPIVEKLLGQ